MFKFNDEICIKELEDRGYKVDSFNIVKTEEFKLIANATVNKEEKYFSVCMKIYDTKKFEQIERVYTILHLLATKLDDEAKKKKESFRNLLPVIYDTWKKEQLFFILEEEIKGETLAQYVLGNQFKTFSDFVKRTKQICDAVAMLHQPFPPIVHCDIKEENLMVDSEDQVVKIFDFDAAYIEGSGNYNVVRSTKGYRPTEMVNSAPVSQSDIYAIGCIIEKVIEHSDWRSKLDSQCNDKLNQIIIKSKEELSRRYYNVKELKDALSEVEILYMLQRQMNELDDKESFNVYSYANDCNGKIEQMKKYLGDYSDVDILYVADRFEQQLAFSMTSIYCKGDITIDNRIINKNTDIVAIPYDRLIACIKSNITTPDGKDILTCITKSFAGQWATYYLMLPTDATDLVCDILNNIVLFKNSYYSQERVADYYSNKCHEVNDILTRKELEGKRPELDMWWDLVINLGNLAYRTEEECGRKYTCNNILLKVYENKRRALKHRLRDNGYNQVLVNQIVDCYNNETRLGETDAEEKMQAFLREMEIKRQTEVDEKNPKSNKLDGFIDRFVQKKDKE